MYWYEISSNQMGKSENMASEMASDMEQRYNEIAQSIQENYIKKYFFLNNETALLDSEFEMLSSIRYDPNLEIEDDKESKFFLLNEHLYRLQLQLNIFQWGFSLTKPALFTKLEETVQKTQETDPNYHGKAYKLRITINKHGDVRIGASPCIPRSNLLDGLDIQIEDHPLSITEPFQLYYDIYLDTEPLPISIFTSFKTTNRKHYNDARARVLDGPDDYSKKQDVLLYNNAGQIVECSISNVAVRKLVPNENNELVERWITPQLSSGCLCGVVRQMLITKGFVSEGTVFLKHIKKGDEILYFNSIIGVARGIIR